MDLRIVNTCNSDCIYCLEQGLRRKRKFIKKEEIFDILSSEKNKDILNFYGGNPLMHPNLLEIIKYSKNIGFKNISLLTNTIGIDKKFISELKKYGLTGISFYFHTFLEKNHNIITQNGIGLNNLLKNIDIITKSGLNYKCIIHVNKQNIKTLYKDVAYLSLQFGILNFEFVKYHLVSRAKKEYGNILEYSLEEEKKYINYLKKLIIKLKINAKFIKF